MGQCSLFSNPSTRSTIVRARQPSLRAAPPALIVVRLSLSRRLVQDKDGVALAGWLYGAQVHWTGRLQRLPRPVCAPRQRASRLLPLCIRPRAFRCARGARALGAHEVHVTLHDDAQPAGGALQAAQVPLTCDATAPPPSCHHHHPHLWERGGPSMQTQRTHMP
jgi:hypothetical protein